MFVQHFCALVTVVAFMLAVGPLVAQTTRPAMEDAGNRNQDLLQDFWTSKKMTSDWGGARTQLDDLGLRFDLSFQHQWQQNFKGGVHTHRAYRDTGTYDLVFRLDFEKLGLYENAGFYFKSKGSYGDGINEKGGDKRYIGRKKKKDSDDMGFYLGADQMVWKENDDPEDQQGLGLFARYGWADAKVERIRAYWQAGASYRGLIPSRDHDIFGFAVSQSILSKVYRHKIDKDADRETVYEWYYKIQLAPWLLLTPDLQVITHPGGDKHARNAIVGGARPRVIL